MPLCQFARVVCCGLLSATIGIADADPNLALPSTLILQLAAPTAESPAPKQRPVDGIMDNSFFVEEAYNQEAGVVQHIFNAVYAWDELTGPDENRIDFVFTQEWPVFSQRHQLSYTLPYALAERGSDSVDGFGDMLLNYRYQLWFDEHTLTAFAPRFSLVLPTGDVSRGFGSDTVGYQWNLPFSTAVGDRWFVHANAGLTFLPDASPGQRNLLNYHSGVSTIYAATPELHWMLEWVGAWTESGDESGHEFGSVISPGVRRAFNFENDSQLVLGLAAPIGLTSSTPEVGVFLYVSFEHAFLKGN
jgi:hypothetical protein